MHKKQISAFSLLIIILMTGCALPAIPFLDSAPAADPIPTMVDDATLSTMIADAAAQKVAQTLEALPPTPQPTATMTETPLPTATPTEIPPTATATPIEYPETGSDLVPEGDTFAYYDYSNRYMLTVPANWLPIRPGEVEYAEAWGLPVAAYPEVSSALQSMQSLDPNTFRLFILDTQEGHFDDSFLSNINLLATPANGATLDEIFAQTVLELPTTIGGLIVTDSNITEDDDGNRMGIVISVWDSEFVSGETMRIYQKQAIFLFDDAALIVTFTSRADFKDTILEDFDKMIESLIALD